MSNKNSAGVELIPFTPLDFRKTLGHFPAGVTTVTMVAKDGTFHGITVSSFTSVSLTPPLVLICIDKTAYANEILRDTGAFCVNFLHGNQVYLSNRFAGRDPQKSFDDIPLYTAATGAPVFAESLGFVDCRIVNAYDGGDHTIFLGEVVQLGAADPASAAGPELSPLIYYKSNYRLLNPA